MEDKANTMITWLQAIVAAVLGAKYFGKLGL